MKKFELALETEKEFNGIKLYRIRALIDFREIKAGDLGGYVQKEENLNQTGNAWVYNDARVYGNAQVFGGAQVYGNAQVFGDAKVFGDARVSKFHQSCSVTNLKWPLTSLPKGVHVGCHFHSMKEWKKNHVKIGMENGLTKEESKAYYELMKALRKVQYLAGK